MTHPSNFYRRVPLIETASRPLWKDAGECVAVYRTGDHYEATLILGRDEETTIGTSGTLTARADALHAARKLQAFAMRLRGVA